MEVEKLKNKRRHKKGIVIRTKEEKRQIRRAKDKEKKVKKRKNNSDNPHIDFDHSSFSDKVKFNEVVHAPPQNLFNVKNYAERRRDKQNNLLLIKKLQGKLNSNNHGGVKVKHNSMSLARRNMLEQERRKVIKEYRELKKMQYESFNKHDKIC